MPRDKPLNRIAFDVKSSARHKDANGYLHVENCHVTKEQVAPYYGYEIANSETLGLEASRVYYVYRPADALKKAAETFNGMPLLFEHHEISAESVPKEYVIGHLGTDAHWDGQYITASLIITDGEAIDAIERGEYRELSAAYQFTPVLKGGVFDGEHYDLRMSDIIANHVALVKEGRAGSDVAVADAAAQTQVNNGAGEKRPRTENRKECTIVYKLLQALKKVVAWDAIPEIEATEVSTAKWEIAVQVIEAQREGLDPRSIGLDFDADASVEDIVARLFGDATDEAKAVIAEKLAELKGAPATDEEGEPVPAAIEPAATAAPAEEPAPAKIEVEIDKDLKECMDKCGIDAENPEMAKAFAEGVKYGEHLMANHAEREKLDREHEREGMEKAMDAKLKKAVADSEAKMRAKYIAAQDCRSVLGVIDNPLAFDSADAIYRKALTALGIDVNGVHASAYPSMLKMARGVVGSQKKVASDSASAGTFGDSALAGLARIKH